MGRRTRVGGMGVVRALEQEHKTLETNPQESETITRLKRFRHIEQESTTRYARRRRTCYTHIQQIRRAYIFYIPEIGMVFIARVWIRFSTGTSATSLETSAHPPWPRYSQPRRDDRDQTSKQTRRGWRQTCAGRDQMGDERQTQEG